LNDREDFITFFPEYTPELITQRQAAIDAADLLPDYSARVVVKDAAFLTVKSCRDDGVRLFGFLLSYIQKTYAADIVESMYDAAGKKYLAAAKKVDWPSVSQLFSSALPFMDEHWAELTEKAKVTPAFLDDFKAKSAAYQAAYTAYKAAEQSVKDKGDEKIMANNAVYSDLMLMLTDAKRVYSDDPERIADYTFKELLGQVQSPKNAGLNGKVIQKGTKTVIKTAKITILVIEKTTTVDDKGRFEITPLPIGKYDIIVEAEGYVTQIFKDMKIRTGVTTRLNVVMELVATAKAG
jgi:Carboxypeptidase regulatory-like domain